MADNPGQPELPSSPPPEGPALEALKTHLNDKSFPALSLTRSLNAYLKGFPQTHQSLADKLGMSAKRPWLSQVIGLAELPEETLAGLTTGSLSFWCLRKLFKNRPQQAAATTATDHNETATNHNETATNHNETATTATETATTETNAATSEARTATTATNGGNNEINAVNDHHNGDTPISPEEDDEDATKTPFKHGKRSEGGGGSRDKTLGELIVSVLIEH